MALLKLNLEQRSTSPATARPPVPSNASIESAPAFGSVSLGQLPAQGLLYSVLVHEIAIFSLLLFWPVVRPLQDMDPPKHWEVTMIPKDALYLPALGGGDSGGPRRGASAAKTQMPTLSVAAWSKAGVSYPGIQAVISNPPHPTNHIQTILQPELPNPPELTAFVPLPNMVKLAETNLTPASPAAADPPKADASASQAPAKNGPSIPTIPSLHMSAPPTIDAPKLVLPVKTPLAGPALQATAGPPASPAPQKATQARVLPGSSGTQARTLVALSVMPAPPDPAPNVPAAEAHGQFAIVALPNLALSRLGPGSAINNDTPASVGAGADPKTGAHDAAGRGEVSVGGGSGTVAGGNGPRPGAGPGAGTTGRGRNALGDDGGGMTIRGVASGSGPGSGSASGAGRGSGPAAGAFAGMTVQGGDWPNGMPASLAPRPPANQQESGSYGLTVVSTGTSGGGLGDFGIFYNEPVYTVYINMSTSADPASPSWTLEYAALHAGEAGIGKVAPPFPAKKETPSWPAELVAKYRNQLVVIFVVIDETGKVQRLRSMQSPSLDLTPPALAALENWEFRPASQNGKPIAVRALLGIPVAAAPSTIIAPPSQPTAGGSR